MPKVVSYGNRVFTNANRNLKDQRFNVFYCKQCRTHILITDADIGQLPKRKTDGAPVFDATKCVVRLNTVPIKDPVKVARPGGLETQYHHACEKCGQIVAYQSVPHSPPSDSDPPVPSTTSTSDRSAELASSDSAVSSTATSAPPRLLVYLVNSGVLWPRYKPRSPWVCKVCGYVCRDSEHLEVHKKQRGHENQEEGIFSGPNGGIGGAEAGCGPDSDAPLPPLIVG
eukprot:GHVQ01024218.1.p1 GENE.GHVQ01024218.1~~GHVQ01024218.1.p1  ORF type:complete len:227 (-),score=16.81 GHVQ01024218.1:868-1548(-)